MDYNIKKLPKSEIEITITVPKEKMEEYKKKACENLSKDVKVKGFRAGHVPANILEEHIGKEYIEAHTQELAVQRSYADAIIKEKIPVVSRPTVKIDSQDPFTFTAKVATMPEIEIKDYKSIKVDKKEVKVDQKDVEAVIEDLKKHGTTYKEVDRAAKKGDRVEVDFEGFDDKGKSVENTKSSNHPIVLGEGSLIPGFEENLEGLKKGEKKEFNLTFPKDYHKKDFQNLKLKFKVEVKKVEESETPELTEELIEQVTGKKIKVDEFKKDIEQNIKARKEQEENQRIENDYVEKLIKKVEVELPESLLEEETEHILLEMKENIAQKGLEFETFLTQAKTTEEELKKKYKGEAERRIKVRLALQYIIEKEKIEVSDKEIQDEFEKVKSFYPPEQHKTIEADFEKGELKTQIVNRLLLRKLFKLMIGQEG